MSKSEYIFKEGEFPVHLLESMIRELQAYPVVLIDAPMGYGKTTIIHQIANFLGVEDKVQSPTYTLVNEYVIERGELPYDKIIHMDLYRLKDTSEAIQAGLEDYFFASNWCFVEWPEILGPILPESYINVKIELLPDNSRKIIVF